jgi:pimeloyl-ACP methyl ester carboxylesterase
VDRPDPTFGQLEGLVLTMLGAGDADAALEAASHAASRFPDRIAYTAFWTACIHGATLQPERALRALVDAVDATAVWWGGELLLEDPDLESVRPLPGFADLVAECERRGAEALRGARVEWDVVAEGGRDSAVLVVLHGRTGNLADLSERWGRDAPRGVTTVVVQSSQMLADGMHCWDDLDVAAADIETVALAVASPQRPVVLAGFSQGGGIAARLALAREPVAARGFVSIAPSFFRERLTPDDVARLMPGAARDGVRAWLGIGEEDERYRPPAEQVGRLLDAAGVPARWSVFTGVGHDYPEPFETHLAEAVGFVLDAPSSISS